MQFQTLRSCRHGGDVLPSIVISEFRKANAHYIHAILNFLCLMGTRVRKNKS